MQQYWRLSSWKQKLLDVLLLILILPSTLFNLPFAFVSLFQLPAVVIDLVNDQHTISAKEQLTTEMMLGLLPSIGLIALWWLFFKFRSMQFRQIPKIAWLGLLMGVLSMLVLIFPRLLWGFVSWHAIVTILLFGLGPFIALCMMLWRIYRNNS